MPPLVESIKIALESLVTFAQLGSQIRLRSYQVEIANAIIDSVRFKRGLSFVVMLPRQSGKNELQAHLEAYLMTIFSRLEPRDIVKISPTWKPQSQNAMRRLERVLSRNLFTRLRWAKESGYIYRIGNVRTSFFSGAPTANIVGATASLLLECDEAQDVEIAKWDRDCAPMAASTNATRVFWGTAWTSTTLLARELRAARQASELDGIQRVFIRDGIQVGDEVPPYRKHVQEQISRLGRQHPMVKTQYFSEEIDAEGGMFPAARCALLWGEHAPQSAPLHNHIYAFTIDVAGEDEGASLDPQRLDNPKRDATALTIFEVETQGNASGDAPSAAQNLASRVETPSLPTYAVVDRLYWTGTKHTSLYPRIRALAETWKPRFVVVDSTGIGSGLATYLESCLSSTVIRFDFTSASKSKLGWDFISLIETLRYREPAWPDKFDPRRCLFLQQLEACQYEILSGPGKLMRWGTPAGGRDPATGDYLHDDLVVSAALVSVLDSQVWGTAASRVTASNDPLANLRF